MEVMRDYQNRGISKENTASAGHRKNEIVIPQFNGHGTEAAALKKIPNGDPLNFMLRILTECKGDTITLEKSEVTRDEDVKTSAYKDGLIYSRTKGTSSCEIYISDLNRCLSKSNKTLYKIMIYVLQKMVEQDFPQKIGFCVQELVDLGMYSTTSNAERGIKDFFEKQKLITIKASLTVKGKSIREKGGILFYNYDLQNGYGFLDLNQNFNYEILASFYTVFPQFAYALNISSFALVRYICFLARQNSRSIKESGFFSISLKAVRENLGLPSVEYVRSHKKGQYKRFIINPIKEAVEAVNEASKTHKPDRESFFSLAIFSGAEHAIGMWLTGHIKVALSGSFAEPFIGIARSTENRMKKLEAKNVTERVKKKAH